MSSMRSAFWMPSKVRPIAITSPTDFMAEPMRERAPPEFLQVPARHLEHDVVERGLEARLGAPVMAFGSRSGVAQGELGGDEGERIAGRL